MIPADAVPLVAFVRSATERNIYRIPFPLTRPSATHADREVTSSPSYEERDDEIQHTAAHAEALPTQREAFRLR